MGQELVIGGYIPGAHGVDAIVVGYYRGQDLIYVAPRTWNAVDGRLKLHTAHLHGVSHQITGPKTAPYRPGAIWMVLHRQVLPMCLYPIRLSSG